MIEYYDDKLSYKDKGFGKSVTSFLFDKYVKNGIKGGKLLNLSDLWEYDITKKIKIPPLGFSGFYWNRQEAREKEKKEIKLKERAKRTAEFIVQRDKYIVELSGEKQGKPSRPKTLKELENIIKDHGTIASAAVYFGKTPQTIHRWLNKLKKQETK